jgi:hypothetical protein
VPDQGLRLGEVRTPHRRQQERQRLGADEVRSDKLMPFADLDLVGDEVQQRERVDHVPGSPSHRSRSHVMYAARQALFAVSGHHHAECDRRKRAC